MAAVTAATGPAEGPASLLQTYTHASAAQIRQLVYWINRVLPGALPSPPSQSLPAEQLPGGGGESEPDEGAAVPGE
jgi:hypothetical protein